MTRFYNKMAYRTNKESVNEAALKYRFFKVKNINCIGNMCKYETMEPFYKVNDCLRQALDLLTMPMLYTLAATGIAVMTALAVPGMLLNSIISPSTASAHGGKFCAMLSTSIGLSLYAALKPCIELIGLLTRSIITLYVKLFPPKPTTRQDYYDELSYAPAQ